MQKAKQIIEWTSFKEMVRPFFLEYGSESMKEGYIRLLISVVEGRFRQIQFLSARLKKDVLTEHIYTTAKKALKWSGRTDPDGQEELRICIEFHTTEFDLIRDSYLKHFSTRKDVATEWIKQEMKSKERFVRPAPRIADAFKARRELSHG